MTVTKVLLDRISFLNNVWITRLIDANVIYRTSFWFWCIAPNNCFYINNSTKCNVQKYRICVHIWGKKIAFCLLVQCSLFFVLTSDCLILMAVLWKFNFINEKILWLKILRSLWDYHWSVSLRICTDVFPANLVHYISVVHS